MPMSQLRCLLSLLLLVSCSAFAQSFPSRPVTLIVPFSPGTGIDILARVIAPKLAEKWGQPVVVENKAGASGNIGTDLVAKAPPDGHTLMVTVNTFTITPSLIKNTPYDVLTDFTFVSITARFEMLLAVKADSPLKTLQDVVAAARKSPGKLNFGAINPGSTQNLSAHPSHQAAA